MKPKAASKPANPKVVAAMAVGTVVALGMVVSSSLELLSLNKPVKVANAAPPAAPPPPAPQTDASTINSAAPERREAVDSPSQPFAGDRFGPDAFASGTANPFAPLPAKPKPGRKRIVRQTQAVADSVGQPPRVPLPKLGPEPSAAPASLPGIVSRPVAIVPPMAPLPELAGTLHGEDAAAMIREGDRTILVAVGDKVGPWQILRIEPGRVWVGSGRRKAVLHSGFNR